MKDFSHLEEWMVKMHGRIRMFSDGLQRALDEMDGNEDNAISIAYVTNQVAWCRQHVVRATLLMGELVPIVADLLEIPAPFTYQARS